MIRLEEITRFQPVTSGSKLVLETDKRRLVRLELNTEGRVRLELETATDIRFLANVEGRETLTFIADGPCAITPEGEGEIWWFTPEMETTSVRVEAPEIFTTIMERQAEPPEVTAMKRYVREGEMRREQALAFEIERLRAAHAEPVPVPLVHAEANPNARKAGEADSDPVEGGDSDTGGAGDEPAA